MIKLNHLIKSNRIYEGLIHTVSLDTTAEMLDKWSGSGNKFKVSPKSSKVIITFIKELDKNESDYLLKLINNLGWFPSSMLINRSELKWQKFDLEEFIRMGQDGKVMSIQLEAKYDLEGNIYDFDVMYHVAQSINREKILRIGLVPKSKEKITKHPERVYLIDSENDANQIAFQFQRKMGDEIKWSLFEIDFKRVRKNDPTIRLFSDPNFRGAFYTLSNIPPRFIKDFGEYDLA